MPPARLCRLRKEARGPAFTKTEFATDSPVEGTGFELPVRECDESGFAIAVAAREELKVCRLPAGELDSNRRFLMTGHGPCHGDYAGFLPTTDPNARVINLSAMAICATASSCNVAMEVGIRRR